MKQLRSTTDDLRALFEVGITARHIAELKLKTCDATDDSLATKQRMDDLDFDVFPVKESGEIYGYVDRADLTGGPCSKYVRLLRPSDLVSESTPLVEILPLLAKQSRAFVLAGNRVQGIVTHGDLQKAPVRLLFFGLVTLAEMQLLRLIRLGYRDDEWPEALNNDKRLLSAQDEFNKRQSKDAAIDLADCLQFCDKRVLVIREPRLRERLGFTSKGKGEKFLKAVESLRNDLAHGQDISGTSWGETLSLVEELEAFLRKCEQIHELPIKEAVTPSMYDKSR